MCCAVDPFLKHKSFAVIYVNKTSLLIIFTYLSRFLFIYFLVSIINMYLDQLQNLLTDFIQIKTKPEF